MSEKPKDNHTLLMGLDTIDLVIDEDTQTVKWVEKPTPQSLRRGYANPVPYRRGLDGDDMVGWSNRGYRSRVDKADAAIIKEFEAKEAQCVNKPRLPEFTCLCLLCQKGEQHEYDAPGCTCTKEPIPKVFVLPKRGWLQKLIDYFIW